MLSPPTAITQKPNSSENRLHTCAKSPLPLFFKERKHSPLGKFKMLAYRKLARY